MTRQERGRQRIIDTLQRSGAMDHMRAALQAATTLLIARQYDAEAVEFTLKVTLGEVALYGLEQELSPEALEALLSVTSSTYFQLVADITNIAETT